MSLSLLVKRIFRRQLIIAGKRVKILSLQINTSPIYLIDEPGWRPADKRELALFAKKYKPAGWFPPVHGVGREFKPTMFGPMAAVYQIRKGNVKQIDQNPIWGLEPGTMILFIEHRRRDMPNIIICGYEEETAEAMKKLIDDIMQGLGLQDDAITTIIAAKTESCDGKRKSMPYLVVRSTSEDEVRRIIDAFKEKGVMQDLEWDVIGGFISAEDMAG